MCVCVCLSARTGVCVCVCVVCAQAEIRWEHSSLLACLASYLDFQVCRFLLHPAHTCDMTWVQYKHCHGRRRSNNPGAACGCSSFLSVLPYVPIHPTFPTNKLAWCVVFPSLAPIPYFRVNGRDLVFHHRFWPSTRREPPTTPCLSPPNGDSW